MRKYVIAVLALVLLASLASLAWAKQADPKAGFLEVDVVKLAGTITALDAKKRTVTIKGDGGKTAVIDAKNARNFDQVKVGDRINIELIEALALAVRKSDAPPSAEAATVVKLAPKGQKPAGVVAEVLDITAEVVAVDHKKRTVTLKGPQGKERTLKVDKAAKEFEKVKKGDQLALRIIEAVAITVSKP